MKNNPNDINAEFYDQIYSDIKGEAVTSAECTLISSLAGEPSKQILDIGIGTGRHAIRLAKMGYQITGIDSSKGMLDILRSKKNPNIEIIEGNFYNIKLDPNKKHDIAILMWNAFNEIALTKKDAKRLINKIFSVLKKDGKILINTEKVPQNKPYKPQFSFNKSINGLGEVKVSWKNISYNAKTNTTVSEEQISINGVKYEPAYIEQRWWRQEEIKELLNNNYKLKKYKIAVNFENYYVLNY